MEVLFESRDSENNKVFFRTTYEKENNTYIFEDKSVKNTEILLETEENRLVFKRVGEVEMYLPLKEGEITHASYHDKRGLAFLFTAHTDRLLITENKIEIEYRMYLDDDMISTHKIWILFH